MAYPKKSSVSASSAAGPHLPAPTGAAPDYTVRGRSLDAPTNTRRNMNPLGDPLMGRQRSLSLRRLPVEHLRGLAAPSGPEPTALNTAAARELGVRHAMVEHSQRQLAAAPVKMNARSPAGLGEASTMRFASSMAEEAQDEVNRGTAYKPQQIGQIGVASVQGHLGFGISGQQDKMGHVNAVQARMLDLQAHYDAAGQSAHWSTRLTGTPVSDVFAQDEGNICAAKRAAHVAHSAAAAANAKPLPDRPVPRHEIPPPDTLLEMMNTATSGRGNFLSDFSVNTNGPPSAHQTDPAGSLAPGRVSGRPRSASVDSMANSCTTCMDEHHQHMKTRARSASGSSDK